MTNTPKNINKLCERCSKKCKQTSEIKLLVCPKFVEKPRQLILDFKIKKLKTE
jgi:hypothetical protein